MLYKKCLKSIFRIKICMDSSFPLLPKQACILHAESPQGYPYLKTCLRSYVLVYFVPCAHDLKYIQTSLRAFLCKLNFSFLPVYTMLNQDNQPIPLPVLSLILAVSHVDHLFKLLLVFLHMRNIFCFLLYVYMFATYWKISKSFFWILLGIWFLAVGKD